MLIPARPKPARDGTWPFNVVVDGCGTAMQTHGFTAKDARLDLATYIYNILNGKGFKNATGRKKQ